MKKKSTIHALRLFLQFHFCITAFVFASYGQNLGVFDTIKNLTKEQRGAAVERIYEQQLTTSSDTAFVFSQLNYLLDYAGKSNNYLLKARVLVLKCNYYWNNMENRRKESIALLKMAIKETEEHGPEWRMIELYNRLGIKLLVTNEYKEGFTYMLQSDRMIEDMNGKRVEGFNTGMCLLNIGWAYSWFFNHERAIDYYKKALELTKEDTSTTVFIYNSMGIAYQEMKRNDTALWCYQKAFKLAESLTDSFYMGLVSSNLGWIYQLRGETTKARPALKMAMPLMERMKCWHCMANISMNLAYTDLLENKLDEALHRAADAKNLLETKPIPDRHAVLSEYYDVLAKVHKRKGNLLLSNVYMDSLLHTKDSIHVKKNANLLANLEAQLTAEQHLAKLNAIELEKKKEQLLRRSAVILAVLLLFIMYLTYSKWMLKKRKDLEVSLVLKENEIDKRKNEILRTKEQLLSYTKKLREKSTMIDRLQRDIETMYPEYANSDTEMKQRKALLERLLSSNILTEEDWTEFKAVFERVHDGFFSRTLNNYPDLTIAEVRYIALTKLGLSPNEMANMLGISPESVKRSIRRLRTKINIDSPFHFDELVKGL
jgi:tetratricopeptide (TPR) repeat protein